MCLTKLPQKKHHFSPFFTSPHSQFPSPLPLVLSRCPSSFLSSPRFGHVEISFGILCDGHLWDQFVCVEVDICIRVWSGASLAPGTLFDRAISEL